MRPSPLFDVEPFRSETTRMALSRQVTRPTLVLGSTQPATVVAEAAVGALGVEVTRRRGGGGAVLLRPDDHLWIDAWIPCGDPLWVDDVSAAAAWVGDWWRQALVDLGIGASQLEVHAGRAVPGQLGGLVCFAGRGPGEVFHRGQKVMGLSQWRGRQGVLFSACAYDHWDPGPLAALVEADPAAQAGLISDLTPAVVGLADLDLGLDPGLSLGRLRDALLSSFPRWGSDRPPPG